MAVADLEERKTVQDACLLRNPDGHSPSTHRTWKLALTYSSKHTCFTKKEKAMLLVG